VPDIFNQTAENPEVAYIFRKEMQGVSCIEVPQEGFRSWVL
jgi:hypothetical protein